MLHRRAEIQKQHFRKKLIGISLGARIREGDCKRIWNGRKLGREF
jgi:hypothetical protein